MALVLFLLDLLLFCSLCAWAVTTCVLSPEDRGSVLTDPAKSVLIGFFSNGIASLTNAALTVNRDWGTGSSTLLLTLWGCWWFNCCFSCILTFGLVHLMTRQNFRDLSKVGPAWMVSIITLVASSCSGGFSTALLPHHRTYALVTAAVSLALLTIGLWLVMMLTTAFLLRLYLHGTLEAAVVLSTFTVLTPLGQGGQSLLLNGQNLQKLFSDSDPDLQLTAHIVYTVCICGACMLWSMGTAWVAVACFSIGSRLASFPRFSITHWCVIVPNGTFALLSLELAVVLGSEFFRVFAAVWSCFVLILWTGLFFRSIRAIIDGTMFKPVSPSDTGSTSTIPVKLEGWEAHPIVADLANEYVANPPGLGAVQSQETYTA